MSEKQCPLVRAACLEHQCHWYIQLLGSHPQTGHPVHEWGCAVAWLPVLLIEGTQQTRQAGAAIESFRNVMAEHGERLVAVAETRKALR